MISKVLLVRFSPCVLDELDGSGGMTNRKMPKVEKLTPCAEVIPQRRQLHFLKPLRDSDAFLIFLIQNQIPVIKYQSISTCQFPLCSKQQLLDCESFSFALFVVISISSVYIYKATITNDEIQYTNPNNPFFLAIAEW